MATREVTIRLKAEDQYSTALDRYSQKMGQAEQATNRASRASDGLRQAVGGMVAAIGVNTVINFAEDFNQLGTEVAANERMFNLLSSEIGSNVDILQELRDATRGGTNDLELMGAANQLMRLNIANSSDELIELTQLISGLKDPTESTGQAVSNFALMLSNQSVMRLDSFGLSAARARERIDELKAAGMDSQEAFNTATIEQMREQYERLGPAIEANVTPLQEFQTELDNIYQRGANNFSTGAMAIVGLFDAIGDSAQRNREHVADIADTLRLIGIEPEPIEQAAPFSLLTSFGLQALLGGSDVMTATDAQVAAAEDVLRINQRINDALREGVRWIDAQLDAERLLQQAAEQRAMTEQNRSMYMGMVNSPYQHLFDLFSSSGGTNTLDMLGNWSSNLEFVDPERTQNVLNNIVNIRAALEGAQAANEQGLLSDQDLAQMQRIADDAERMAGAIQQGVENFNNMTLSQALGESGGNVLFGGIGDEVMAALRERNNLDADALQDAADAYDLAAGRITESTITMRDTVVPILARLAETQGVNLAIDRTGQVEDYLRRMQLAGISENGFLPQLGLELSTGTIGGFDFQGTLLDPFREAFDQIRSDVSGMSGETDNGASILSGLPTGVDKAIESAGELQNALDKMASQGYTLNINLVPQGEDWLIQAARAGGGVNINGNAGTGAGSNVRDNGGQVAGAVNSGRGNVGLRRTA